MLYISQYWLLHVLLHTHYCGTSFGTKWVVTVEISWMLSFVVCVIEKCKSLWIAWQLHHILTDTNDVVSCISRLKNSVFLVIPGLVLIFLHWCLLTLWLYNIWKLLAKGYKGLTYFSYFLQKVQCIIPFTCTFSVFESSVVLGFDLR